MIIYDYSSEQKIFSKVPGFKNFNFEYKSNTIIGNILKPIIIATCYKGIPQKSMYDPSVSKEYHDRCKELMIDLHKLHPSVPILRCSKFMNACYIPDLLDLYNQYGEAMDNDLKNFCFELGADYDEFKRKLSNDMVLIGDSFANPPTLAHELGHYMNTRLTTDKVGNTSHRLLSVTRIVDQILTILDWVTLPFNLFYKGKNKYLLSVISAVGFLIRTISGTPVVLAEYKASEYGLKLLKKVEVTDSEYEMAKSDLRYYLNGYGTHRITIPLILTGITGTLAYMKYKNSKKGI